MRDIQSSTRSEKTRGTRFGELVVSVVVLTFVTVIVGYGGWALLTLVAKLGGPDPKFDDALLRQRLVEWPDRNRAFIRNNARGTLPWKP